MTATYLGIKGTRGMQEFLPNTYPVGAANPCPACPTGFRILDVQRQFHARSPRQIQLRRRLHNGFTATLQYTYSKSIDDDAALGGQGATSAAPSATSSPNSSASGASAPTPVIAQNWLDLSAERGLSTFDQRHLLNLQMQYTTGMGMGGGTLLSGWRGALFKEWTVATEITAGSGLPLTPVYPDAGQGTGVTGQHPAGLYRRAALCGSARIVPESGGLRRPAPGEWGNAGRDSITGPAQFTLNASLGRTFRVSDRLNLDLRVDSTNALNHVTFTVWNTIVTARSSDCRRRPTRCAACRPRCD